MEKSEIKKLESEYLLEKTIARIEFVNITNASILRGKFKLNSKGYIITAIGAISTNPETVVYGIQIGNTVKVDDLTLNVGTIGSVTYENFGQPAFLSYSSIRRIREENFTDFVLKAPTSSAVPVSVVGYLEVSYLIPIR